jgi:hypothetical protein
MNGVKNAAEALFFIFMDCWRCFLLAKETNERTLSARTKMLRLQGDTENWFLFTA